MVSRILIRRSPPQPRSRKTPRGGKKTAAMNLQISLKRWDVSQVGDDASKLSGLAPNCVAKLNAIGETYVAEKGILTVLSC